MDLTHSQRTLRQRQGQAPGARMGGPLLHQAGWQAARVPATGPCRWACPAVLSPCSRAEHVCIMTSCFCRTPMIMMHHVSACWPATVPGSGVWQSPSLMISYKPCSILAGDKLQALQHCCSPHTGNDIATADAAPEPCALGAVSAGSGPPRAASCCSALSLPLGFSLRLALRGMTGEPCIATVGVHTQVCLMRHASGSALAGSTHYK